MVKRGQIIKWVQKFRLYLNSKTEMSGKIICPTIAIVKYAGASSDRIVSKSNPQD